MKNKYWSNCQLNNLIDKAIPKNYYAENPSFIFSDIYYCGHKISDHSLNNNQCIKKEFYNYLGFSP
jgi:hypothetical protein